MKKLIIVLLTVALIQAAMKDIEALKGLISIIIISAIIIHIKQKNKREKEQKHLERQNLFQQNGVPEIANPGFVLQNGEKLHCYLKATLMQPRRKTEFIGKSSGMRVRIAKGISYTFGDYAGKPKTKLYLSKEGQGTLFLTNKRLVFNGIRNLSYPLNKIADLKFCEDGFAILRENETVIKLFQCQNKAQLEELFDILDFLLGYKVMRMEHSI